MTGLVGRPADLDAILQVYGYEIAPWIDQGHYFVGQMIPGFDAAVVGMSVGDKKTITLAPAEAYGDYNDEMIVKVPATKYVAVGGLWGAACGTKNRGMNVLAVSAGSGCMALVA